MDEVAKQHFRRAEKLRLEGKVDASINALLAAIKVAPNYAAAHHNLGFLYEQKNERKKALVEYKEAIRLNPKMERAYVNMGALLLNSVEPGWVAEAIDMNRRAICLFPQNVELHYNLGIAYASAGQRALAISEYKEAIRCDHTFSNAYANLGKELALDKDWASASEAYQQSLDLGPDETALRYALCNALIQLRRTNEAIAEFKTILQTNPKDAEGYFQLGRAYLIQALQERSRESIRLAEETLKKALSLRPFSPQSIILLHQVYKLKKRVEKSRRFF